MTLYYKFDVLKRLIASSSLTASFLPLVRDVCDTEAELHDSCLDSYF